MGHQKPRPRMIVSDSRDEAFWALYEERAAVLEHLGGLPREQAEDLAREAARRWSPHEAQVEFEPAPGWRERTRVQAPRSMRGKLERCAYGHVSSSAINSGTWRPVK